MTDNNDTHLLSENAPRTKPLRVKIRSWLLWLLIYAFIFTGVTQWQQRNMLSTGEPLAQSNLRLLDVHGQAFAHEFANGDKDTLVYFFAPWCSVCHASIDNLESLKNQQNEELAIVVIALDWRSLDEVDEFLAQHTLTMPVLLGTREIQKNFAINAFPSYYLISKHGEVKARNIGYTTYAGMQLMVSLYGSEGQTQSLK